MILLGDIVSIVAPNYKRQHDVKTEGIEKCFTVGPGHDSPVQCLLDAFNKTAEDIVAYLSANTINQHVNKKKMINLIRNSQVNNELLLFLSGYFDCNIWIYYSNNKMFKVYYMEECFQELKQNVYVLYLVGDTAQYFSGAPLRADIVEQISTKYITIPVGMRENKHFVKGVHQTNPLFDDIIDDEFAKDFPEDPCPYAVLNVKNFLRKFT
jgi:hypothetical protein